MLSEGVSCMEVAIFCRGFAEIRFCRLLQPKGKSSSSFKNETVEHEEGSARGEEGLETGCADDRSSTMSGIGFAGDAVRMPIHLNPEGDGIRLEDDDLILSPIMQVARMASSGNIVSKESADSKLKSVMFKGDGGELASLTPHGSRANLQCDDMVDVVARTDSGASLKDALRVQQATVEQEDAKKEEAEAAEEIIDPKTCLMQVLKHVKGLHDDVIRHADRYCFGLLQGRLQAAMASSPCYPVLHHHSPDRRHPRFVPNVVTGCLLGQPRRSPQAFALLRHPRALQEVTRPQRQDLADEGEGPRRHGRRVLRGPVGAL